MRFKGIFFWKKNYLLRFVLREICHLPNWRSLELPKSVPHIRHEIWIWIRCFLKNYDFSDKNLLSRFVLCDKLGSLCCNMYCLGKSLAQKLFVFAVAKKIVNVKGLSRLVSCLRTLYPSFLYCLHSLGVVYGRSWRPLFLWKCTKSTLHFRRIHSEKKFSKTSQCNSRTLYLIVKRQLKNYFLWFVWHEICHLPIFKKP